MKVRILLISFVLAATACSKLDKTMDTTEKMGETTDKMAQSTDTLVQKSTGIEIISDDLYTGMREVESVMTQAEVFDRIKSAPGIMEKSHYALIYFAAMEFQNWQGEGSDDEAARQRQFARGVELFFSHILDLVDDSFPVEGALFGDNNWTVLSVMAMTMAKIHPEQEARAKRLGFKPVTFYSLIQDGLRAKGRYEAGLPVEEFELRVLENERVARYLLQLRHNFFKALVIGQLTDIEDSGWMGDYVPFVGEGLGAWLNKFDKSMGGWKTDLAAIPRAEMAKVNEWLWKAWETQVFLEEIGNEPEHNGSLNNLFEKGKIGVTEAEKKSVSAYLPDFTNLWTLKQVQSEEPHNLFLRLVPKVMGWTGKTLMSTCTDQEYQAPHVGPLGFGVYYVPTTLCL